MMPNGTGRFMFINNARKKTRKKRETVRKIKNGKRKRGKATIWNLAKI
jgi:hypothetical protein